MSFPENDDLFDGLPLPSPVEVEAHLLDDGVTLRIICPYCGVPHTHGAGAGPGIAYGLRASHCSDTNPGYILTPEKAKP